MSEIDVVHAGGPDLLPLHKVPPGQSVAVAFHRAGVTCETCKGILAPLDDRRQRAREAGQDIMHDLTGRITPFEAAIETATQVKITPEAILAAKPTVPWETEYERLTAFLRALGFEVVE